MPHYFSQWIADGYDNDMGSASFLPPPPKGFVRLYYFTSAKHAISNIENARLKLARFSDANDPFELMGLMLREQSVRTAVKEFKKSCNDETGLLCFSGNWTNPLLWSHYGDKHAGVCLGFDVEKGLSHPVSYEDARLLARLAKKGGSFVLDDNLKQQLLITKSNHWKYEQERRVFVELRKALKIGDLYFRSFDKRLRLAEVILGPRCNLKTDDVKKAASGHPCAIIYRSRLEFGGFRVIRNGRDLPNIAQALSNRPNGCT